MEGLASVISEYREQMHLSHKELALRARISLRKVKEIESGEYIPDNTVLLKLSSALDIPIYNLIGKKYPHVH